MITSKRIVRRGLAALSAIVLAVIILLAGVWWGGHPSALPSALRGSFFETRGLVLVNQAMNILTTRYYRPLNRSTLVDQALSGMVAGLDDPYSRYLTPQAYRDRNEERTQGQGGIGIDTVAEPDGLRVRSVFADAPAARGGLMAGDLIIKVGSVSLADQADNLGPDLIRGPAGTSVQLTFKRDGVEHVVSIERANIVAPVASWQMLTYDHRRIGHLTLTGFTEG
ncbi:MAG: PDZ domain-containing protein, partial [Solirubrobacterales bacterium]|nr:PDZ domain-containing protein [Solirubrobacterales bacterium]